MKKIQIRSHNSNFYIFCAIYLPMLDVFDCIQTQSKIIKHVGGTYSGCRKDAWRKSELYYNLFSKDDRKKMFYNTYISVFDTHRGVKAAFQKVCKNFDHAFFHASIMLMRKKGIIPTRYSLVDYEKIVGQKDIHWQFGIQLNSLMYQNAPGEFVEITLIELSGKEFSAYQSRVFVLLDPDILSSDYIISGKDMIKQLSDGSLDLFAYAHRAVVRSILK